MDETVVASIIIVTYNSTGTIRQCLQNLQDFTHTPHEVIVCDNASTDETVSIVTSEFPGVRVVRSPENLGVAAANNLAVTHALGKVLVFLNPDLYVSENWFEPLLECLESNSKVATASPAIRHLTKGEPIEAVGNEIYLSGLTYLQQRSETSGSRTYLPVTVMSGACFLIKRDLFEQVGEFCKELFLYYDDTEFSIRLNMLGLKHLVVPGVVVIHDYHPSFGANKINYLERNRYLAILAYFPVWALLITLPALVLSELMIWVFCLFKGKAFFDAKTRAWEGVFRQKTWLQERRRKYRELQKPSDNWLTGLSPFVNLQYLQAGFLSRIGEVVLFIIGLPCMLLLRLVILIMEAIKA